MENGITIQNEISAKIYTIHGVQVMLDSDLAYLYGVETKVLNQAVNRNIERFPDYFRFQLTKDEYTILMSQFVTSSSSRGGKRKLPFVFTEQGVSMLSAVLKSKTAIEISIKIINSFVNMRKLLSQQGDLFTKLNLLEERQIGYEIKTDEKIGIILNALEDKNQQPKQGIFFDGQFFDAHIFISNLVKSAKKSILLIDNYIDESVLLLLSKRNTNCKATIYTKTISKELKLDLDKYNKQYNNQIIMKEFTLCHDRFLILDESDVYHIGASLKDMGKKRFAFSKIEKSALDLLEKIQQKDSQ